MCRTAVRVTYVLSCATAADTAQAASRRVAGEARPRQHHHGLCTAQAKGQLKRQQSLAVDTARQEACTRSVSDCSQCYVRPGMRNGR